MAMNTIVIDIVVVVVVLVIMIVVIMTIITTTTPLKIILKSHFVLNPQPQNLIVENCFSQLICSDICSLTARP